MRPGSSCCRGPWPVCIGSGTGRRPKRKAIIEPYVGLFLAAFVAATLFPAASEAAFFGLLAADHDPALLWSAATVGNTAGAAVNWFFGRFLLRFERRRWFPFRLDRLGRAQEWFQRWGVWSLLLAWTPLVGDVLTFIAGFMRVRFGLFLLLTGLGKGGRYGVVWGLFLLAGG